MQKAHVGSSPLTRGKPWTGPCGRLGWRLIPAHAGKTPCEKSRGSRSPAHPRSRGENLNRVPDVRHAVGSSPLTRGKQGELRTECTLSGLIPAHAGKTLHIWSHRFLASAHPRSRGENDIVGLDGVYRAGSSPLTRGKLARFQPISLPDGLIPAHAGKTFFITVPPFRTRAHPRSRGENLTPTVEGASVKGSSPLTRGKREQLTRKLLLPRLIPAHAGKTVHCRRRSARHRAHPRSRGENEIARAEDVNSNGSSPLTRGKRVEEHADQVTVRLIPAHAGKTTLPTGRASPSWAHPRSRGENAPTPTAAVVPSGSSPLTRGKQPRTPTGGRHSRLIPAHAGKTPW